MFELRGAVLALSLGSDASQNQTFGPPIQISDRFVCQTVGHLTQISDGSVVLEILSCDVALVMLQER